MAMVPTAIVWAPALGVQRMKSSHLEICTLGNEDRADSFYYELGVQNGFAHHKNT